jgi:hypothetical protein
VVQQ